MKISKLFHWLYALLMLLPAFFVGGRMLYTVFNKNAKDSYSGNNTSEYQLVDVDSFSLNERYLYNATSTGDNLINPAPQDLFINNFELITLTNSSDYQWVDTHVIKCLRFNNSGTANIYIRFIDDSNNVRDVNTKTNAISFTFNYESGNISDIYVKSLFKRYVYSENYYLDNAFIYSMEQLNEIGLFSWAKDSFIVEPFSYITGLFGIEQTSPINTLLSYWCSISVIWLVFDLLMYVPLLVHRWLDKGVLE